MISLLQTACFFTGLLFGYFVIVPLSVSFFINYEASASIVNMIDVNQYLSTVIVASLASALVFQLPLLVYFLTRMGLVSSSFLKRYRRHAFVGLLVIAAIITPPDIFSLILVIIPLYWLYVHKRTLPDKFPPASVPETVRLNKVARKT